MATALARAFTEPRPDYAFELSEAGIAWARPSSPGVPSFEPILPGAIVLSPLRDNVSQPDVLAAAVRKVVGDASARKRRRAVLILPDFCARVAVLDFATFPSNPEEQMSLVRFRMKKTVAFDLDSAAIQYHAQASSQGKVNVVAVVASLEILARYEAPFRAAGLHAGMVTTSSLAALELDRESGITLLAKLSGQILSLAVQQNGALRLLRTIELTELNAEELLGVLHQTLPFIEDELGAAPASLLGCGIDPGLLQAAGEELQLPTKMIESRWGRPGEYNAGLLGYLESIR